MSVCIFLLMMLTLFPIFRDCKRGCCIQSNSLFTSEVLARLCTRETAFTTRGHLLLMQAKVLTQLSRGPNRTHILFKKLWSTSLLQLLVCRVCMSNFIGHCHFHLQLCCTLSEAVYENSHSPISLQHLILSLFFYYYQYDSFEIESNFCSI